jgi:hypothetical protein
MRFPSVFGVHGCWHSRGGLLCNNLQCVWHSIILLVIRWMKLYYGMKSSLHMNIIADMSYVHDLKSRCALKGCMHEIGVDLKATIYEYTSREPKFRGILFRLQHGACKLSLWDKIHVFQHLYSEKNYHKWKLWKWNYFLGVRLPKVFFFFKLKKRKITRLLYLA